MADWEKPGPGSFDAVTSFYALIHATTPGLRWPGTHFVPEGDGAHTLVLARTLGPERP